jgi:transposase
MTQWARPPQSREQLVLFAERLDDVVPQDHRVRLLDEILGQLDWSRWEAGYCVDRGQPAIHPRVLAGALLYGLLTRIRGSRPLEEALVVRLDFRWLVEGQTIDHTTLSEFRRKHRSQLKDLFVQIGLLARERGWLPLEQLAFDGTRVRASNRRRGTRTPDELRQMRAALAERFRELEAQMAEADGHDEELFGSGSAHVLPEALADVARRQAEVQAALAEVERAEQAGETLPKRIPLSDPQSRVMPNKDGGYAPNYTPLATVDVASGLIVSAEVIAGTDEDKHVLAAIADVQEQFGLDAPPPEMLADGLMATGENLAAFAEAGVTLYSPIAGDDPDNPALREDPAQPVPPEQWDRLPTKAVGGKRGGARRLDKAAFVYDAGRDCYWCPQGQPLPHAQTIREDRGRRGRVRHRYQADPQTCAACPLRERCLSGRTKRRQIYHEEHEALRIAHARHMATPHARETYARRRHPGERPFAMIKHHFGARRFLLRGLERVRCEWQWLATAFNLHRLIGLMIHSGADPPPGPAYVLAHPSPP